MDFTEINSRGKREELLGRIDRQNSRFRTAKTIIIKFGLHASFVELESTKSALNEWYWDRTRDQASHDPIPIPLGYRGLRGFSSGRPRGTTPADDQYIVLQARRNRRQTAGEIARHTTQVTGRPISRFTVARRLHGGGLFARRPVRCVPLMPAHRRRRSLWCREHRNWRDNEWG
ncbi:transposable element Tcb1 transposase [Trichonephila clavipes]|nr:transposable element Tcb1 transposase [Trichonephila clavipes]